MAPTQSPIPTPDEVTRITAIADPVIRNLRITQCYYELSSVMAARTGFTANWCTFATWASKQAGQTIRKEDLARQLERRLKRSPAALQASSNLAMQLDRQGSSQLMRRPELALSASHFTAPVDRASDAVSRGNKKVFEEIGREFARFYATCFPNGAALEPQELASFCSALQPGEPPEGQEYLNRAFRHYAQALQESSPKTRAELMLLANIEIGFHEQTRLQPEIAESLDAGWMSFSEFARALFQSLFPQKSWLHLAKLYLGRLIGRPTAIDQALRALYDEVRVQLRQAITEQMMTLSLPSGIVLRLGEDLAVDFPESLQHIDSTELSDLLAKYDVTPNSTSGTGAFDWAELPDRLHFIIDLFRCYQERPALFDPPFSPEQVAAMRDGRRPQGRL